ncbi:hypothetical protein L596_006065 [Steinernema carpocapsae]|uniref:DUF7808 domain-containing protein n=1 Tax=Steinernema carpocapsae TaxID=34508 RepID=A0A4U8V100_STECR|nr:hypothetical protein L596_006065 [Steinernema carpocapsae]
MIVVLFFVFLLLQFAFCDDSSEVDYNKYVKWGESLLYFKNSVFLEKRTLICGGSGLCKLAVGNEGPMFDADCFTEMYRPLNLGRQRQQTEDQMIERFVCDIACRGADRDSVISKIPSHNHNCVRFHSYNSLHRSEDWFIWR